MVDEWKQMRRRRKSPFVQNKFKWNIYELLIVNVWLHIVVVVAVSLLLLLLFNFQTLFLRLFIFKFMLFMFLNTFFSSDTLQSSHHSTFVWRLWGGDTRARWTFYIRRERTSWDFSCFTSDYVETFWFYLNLSCVPHDTLFSFFPVR